MNECGSRLQRDRPLARRRGAGSCVVRLRVTVSDVLDYLAAGMSEGETGATPNRYAQAMLAKSQIQKEALNLPARERIELVVELWDSLTPGEIPVPEWQRDLIRNRLAALEDIPPEERSVPWEAVRRRIFADRA